jgi:nucleoside triphosphate diphosphatase
MPDTAEAELRRLLDIMAALRDPDRGCPWDRVQDFATIAPYTIEEAYEVADAIARHDFAALPDELGDLLFQVVYHARMAEEAGSFAFADVARRIADKMIRRHPHVFPQVSHRVDSQVATGAGPNVASHVASHAAPGDNHGIGSRRLAGSGAARATYGSGDAVPRDATAQTAAWEEQKRTERLAAAQTGSLAGVPAGLPALTRAAKLTTRAARVGFDWPDAAAVLEKLDEEIGELRAELPDGDPVRLADEVGDLLFVLANLARKLELDPEACLRQANLKFERRFNKMEQNIESKQLTLSETSLQEMEAAWQEVKRTEHAQLNPP